MKHRASSTHKKVVIRKLDRELVKGYVNPNACLGSAAVEIIDREGRSLKIPLGEIKGIYFVRDFEGDHQRPERKVFQSRPKLSGLWIRMTFKDNEVLDGLISKNLLDLEPSGFFVTPPDLFSNNLKLFIPRSALASLDVLGVISNGAVRRTSGLTRRSGRKQIDTSAQIGLFAPASSQFDVPRLEGMKQGEKQKTD